uniref:ATP synthase complex subunit 8 n=1 Tax=Orsilochides guttata TaxID=2080398 RepID=A0A2P1CLT8_9HEMI|nr:ATP synthase F0 subunit 8 [Orsilochides guttata]
MPQMAPLYWETLFIMFILSLILMSIIIYHMTSSKMISTTSQKMMTKQINWKW